MRRSVSFGVRGLGTVLAGSLLFLACSGDGETDRPDETGGTGPTGGSAGSGVTGGSGGMTGGSGGGGAGSGGCPACTPQTCMTNPLPTDTINDFEDLYFPEDDPTSAIFGILDDMGALKPEWWLGYYRGSFAYPGVPEACSGEPMPPSLVSREQMNGNMHVTGTVGTYSGFGVWMGQCLVDMTGTTGLSFSIGGDAGPSGMLKVSILTNSNAEADMCLTGRGACDPTTAGACTPPSTTIAVPSTPGTVTVPWTEFAMGSPTAGVDPAEIIQVQWDFDWAEGGTPYEVDVTVDDVAVTR